MGLRSLIFAGIGALVAVTAACGLNDRSPAQKVEAVCSAFCGCEEVRLPSRQQACIEDCIDEAGNIGDLLSEECVQCFVDHKDRCSTIENDCEAICDLGPEPDPPPPDFIDAGMPPPPPPIIDAF